MPGATVLQGDRVALRTVEREDASLLQRPRNDPALRAALGVDAPIDETGADSFFEDVVSGDEAGVNLLVCVEDDCAGAASLFDVDDNRGEVAQWLLPAYRGEGLATESMSLLLEYAFEDRHLHRVVAQVYDFNEASQALVEKLGFEREGVRREDAFVDGAYRDTYRYALPARKWRAD